MRVKIALQVAWSLHGTPYIWGGDDPSGFDCSGLCVEILKSVGELPRESDYTAEMLWQLFKDKQVRMASAGCLVFWGNSQKMTHVEFCIDSGHTMGASGGGSKTVSVEIANKQNAYVKVRPIRPGFKAIVKVL